MTQQKSEHTGQPGTAPEQKAAPHKRELRRQVFHLLLGIFIASLVEEGVLNPVVLAVLIVLGFFVSFYSKSHYIPVIGWFLKKFERPEYQKSFPGKGALFYLLGVFIVLTLFEREIALAAIMVLALGDSISHLWGIHFGKISNPFSDKKFLEGSIAGFAAGFVGAVLYVSPFEAAMASGIAMFAEAIEVKIGVEQVDDNLIIPIVAAVTIWILRVFFISQP